MSTNVAAGPGAGPVGELLVAARSDASEVAGVVSRTCLTKAGPVPMTTTSSVTAYAISTWPAGSGRRHRRAAGHAGQLATSPRSTIVIVVPAVVLVRDGDALPGATERDERAQRGEQLRGRCRVGRRRRSRPPSGVPSASLTTMAGVADPAERARRAPPTRPRRLVELVEIGLRPARSGRGRASRSRVLPRSLLIDATMAVDGHVLGDRRAAVLGRPDRRLGLGRRRLHDERVVLEAAASRRPTPGRA